MKELSLHILDLVQNSIRAEATLVEICITESIEKNLLEIEINDNGKGMPHEILDKASDPFFTSRTTRDVGLGIPLFKQMAEHCNGNISLISEEGIGTRLISTFEINHIDRQPLGDIEGVLVLLLVANPSVRFVYTHQTISGKYVFDTLEIKNILGNSTINDSGIIKFIKEMIRENLVDINANC